MSIMRGWNAQVAELRNGAFVVGKHWNRDVQDLAIHLRERDDALYVVARFSKWNSLDPNPSIHTTCILDPFFDSVCAGVVGCESQYTIVMELV